MPTNLLKFIFAQFRAVKRDTKLRLYQDLTINIACILLGKIIKQMQSRVEILMLANMKCQYQSSFPIYFRFENKSASRKCIILLLYHEDC